MRDPRRNTSSSLVAIGLYLAQYIVSYCNYYRHMINSCDRPTLEAVHCIETIDHLPTYVAIGLKLTQYNFSKATFRPYIIGRGGLFQVKGRE